MYRRRWRGLVYVRWQLTVRTAFLHCEVVQGESISFIKCKGPFIATQLNSTRRRVELCRYKRALRSITLQSSRILSIHFFLALLEDDVHECNREEVCVRHTSNVTKVRQSACLCSINNILLNGQFVQYVWISSVVSSCYSNDFPQD